jgi:uncharacterized membrane protein YjfL (UPF0719 family)
MEPWQMNSSICASVPFVLAEAVNPTTWNLRTDSLLHGLIAVCIFSVVGVAVMALCVWVMCRVVPFSVRKEIEEDQNVALGIVMGSIILGISIIIAASVMG